MASVSTADTWRESGGRADRRVAARPEGADYVSRIGRPPVPPPPARTRSTELPPFPEDMARAGRSRDERPAALPPRPSADRTARPSRNAGRRPVSPDAERPRAREDRSRDLPDLDGADDSRGPRSPERRPAGRRPGGRGATAQAPERGGRLRGAVAVLAVFLVTLAGAALESWIGGGLGVVTVVTLTAASTVAAVMVRRRDLLTPVIAPPLIYIVVAVLNTALAPAASLNLASMATLLIRGFPAMAVATAAAGVVALVRWAARR
ncbi:DUF6542 domain-containing protein [Geodermatophilus sp. URMC 60]